MEAEGIHEKEDNFNTWAISLNVKIQLYLEGLKDGSPKWCHTLATNKNVTIFSEKEHLLQEPSWSSGSQEWLVLYVI